MKVQLKEGNKFIEVDTELSNEIIDTYEKQIDKTKEDLEKTIELKMDNTNETDGNR